MPTDAFVCASPAADTLVCALTGRPGAGFGPIAVVVGLALPSLAAGPLVTALAVWRNSVALIPSPASTLGCMALGFCGAGVVLAALFLGMAAVMRESALADAPGALTLVKEGSGGATLRRTDASGEVTWEGRCPDARALRFADRLRPTRVGQRREVRVELADGRTLGRDRGVLLAWRGGAGADLDAPLAAAREALAAWSGG